ncbi:MAG: NfeD family protein [Candidatus Cloacimonetes bacterium]|jgi:membrane protein implicated in regulation of membrane protease activity|nr:NfeD family protein [Candidatus Cloacimonadota bacterium]
MEAWIIWIAIGIICLIIEIVTPGFIFFSFGLGAIFTGLFSIIFSNYLIQFFVFAIATLISFALMRKFAGFILKSDITKSNVSALIDKQGIVTKIISTGKRGYVKIEGEEWSAICNDLKISIEEGTSVKVLKTEGNKVIVTPIKEEN